MAPSFLIREACDTWLWQTYWNGRWHALGSQSALAQGRMTHAHKLVRYVPACQETAHPDDAHVALSAASGCLETSTGVVTVGTRNAYSNKCVDFSAASGNSRTPTGGVTVDIGSASGYENQDISAASDNFSTSTSVVTSDSGNAPGSTYGDFSSARDNFRTSTGAVTIGICIAYGNKNVDFSTASGKFGTPLLLGSPLASASPW